MITLGESPEGDELWREGLVVVYRARGPTGRPITLKVLRLAFDAPALRAGFLREVACLTTLVHPSIVPLLDTLEARSQLIQVLPAVESNLHLRLAAGRGLRISEVLEIGHTIATALAYVHDAGWVHCNVKPQSIWFAAGSPLLADFSLVWRSGDPMPDPVFGTLAYMSPEQSLVGQPLDGRSDMYSLGCVLYEMLTGRPPFEERSAAALVEAHRSRAPRPVQELRADVPVALRRIVHQALEKNPAKRFPTAHALTDALGAV